MNNYEQLKATTKKDEDTVVSLHVPKEPERAVKIRKTTVASVLISALKADNFKAREMTVENKFVVPVPKYTILSVLAVISICILLVVMSTFVDMIVMIPATLVFLTLAMPCVLLVFFLEFNTRKSIKAFPIVMLIILGIFSNIIVTAVCDRFLTTIIYRTYIKTIGMPLFWLALCSLSVFIFCNILRVYKLPECILIGASFTIGYVIGQSLCLGFSELFIDEQINIVGRPDIYSLPLIINEPDDLKNSFMHMISNWTLNYFYYPILLVSLSVLVSSVVSAREKAKAEKLSTVKSMYLLLILTIFVYIIGTVNTNFYYFDVILRIFSLILSVFLAIRMLNYCLLKELSHVSK